MRIFVAGGTGVIGRSLLPRLLEEGHDLVALVRSPGKAKALEDIGAKTTLADPLDKEALTAAIRAAEPEVIIHELTALANVTDLKNFDRQFSLTNRFRTEVTDTMINAARELGTRRFIVQSYCGWPYAREGEAVKTEEDALDPNPPASFRESLAAIRHIEDTARTSVQPDTLALRYGMLYGPGTAFSKGGPIVEFIRKHKMPIVGDGGGIWSFIHVHDAALATAHAVSRGTPGIYNIVDDEPAPVSIWLPYLADLLNAKPPRKVPVWLAKLMIGDSVSMMTEIRGGSNAKAKRELGWRPIYSSWRRGFAEELG